MTRDDFPSTKAPQPTRRWRLLGAGWVAVIVLALFWIYWQVTDNRMTGFLHDDAIYALTGKALALGQGYCLLNLPVPGTPDFTWQVKYPIAYPLLLSLGWLIQPHFPKTLPWLHGLTNICAVLTVPLLYRYLRQAKQTGKMLTVLICLLVAANFHYILYATSLMSEAPYCLWSVLALWLTEKDNARPSWRRMAGIVLASTLAFHTRTVGLTLIAAIFMAWGLRQQWKQAGIYLISTLCLTVIPWGVWIQSHSMALTPLSYPIAYVYGGYGIEYAINAPHNWLSYLQHFILQGLIPVLNCLPNLMLPQVAFWLSSYPQAYDWLALSLTLFMLIPCWQRLRSGLASTSGLYLAFYLLAISGWMYPNQVMRFLVVILPWLWLYSLRGGMALIKTLWPKTFTMPIPRGASLALFSLSAAFLLWPSISGYSLLHKMRSLHWLEPSGKTAPLWQDYESVFQYVNQATAHTERIASIWDPVFYLYTGHPTFGLFTSSLQPVNGQVTPGSFRQLKASFHHYGVKYIVVEPFIVNQQVQLPENPVATALLAQFPHDFRLVYVAPNGLLQVYRFQPSH